MKKELRIVEGIYINLDHICSWFIDSGLIVIHTSIGEFKLGLDDTFLSGGSTYFNHIVAINELKRIEREIHEYMNK